MAMTKAECAQVRIAINRLYEGPPMMREPIGDALGRTLQNDVRIWLNREIISHLQNLLPPDERVKRPPTPATPRPAVDVKVTVKTDQGEMTLAEWQRDNKGELIEVTQVQDDGRVMVPEEPAHVWRKPEPSKNLPFDCLNVHEGPRYDDPPGSEPQSSGYRCMCFECALSRGEA